jgi:spore coat polysaccharide biosynthesis protein SpsF
MLARVVNRTRRAATLDDVVVATTTQPADDVIVRLCEARGWPCFRGSEDDVLDRYYQAAVVHKADAVFRVTSDAPLLDPEIIDKIVQRYFNQSHVDYVSNDFPCRTFPLGMEAEVFSFKALERAWREDRNPAWREHVTPYILRHPELFAVDKEGVRDDTDRSGWRLTVDTEDDLALVRRIYEHFAHDRFHWKDVLSLLEDHPEWVELNRHVRQKTVPDHE